MAAAKAAAKKTEGGSLIFLLNYLFFYLCMQQSISRFRFSSLLAGKNERTYIVTIKYEIRAAFNF
jgi:hypothetical protein